MEKKLKCRVCGKEVEAKDAWNPHLRVVQAKLGRRVTPDDLEDFVLCGECGLLVRAQKAPVDEEFKTRTYRFLDTYDILCREEARRRAEKKRRLTCTIADLVGLKQPGGGNVVSINKKAVGA